MIIRDESVHGTYIGYKFQLGFNELPEDEQDKLKDWMYNLLYELYENEERYTEELYDDLGWTEEVKPFTLQRQQSFNELRYGSLICGYSQ